MDAGTVARIRTAVRERQEVRETLRNRRRDGSLFWNELFIAPIVTDREVRSFVGVQTDVTASGRPSAGSPTSPRTTH